MDADYSYKSKTESKRWGEDRWWDIRIVLMQITHVRVRLKAETACHELSGHFSLERFLKDFICTQLTL